MRAPAAERSPRSERRDSRRSRTRQWFRGFRERETWAAYAFLSPWIIGFLVLMAGPMIISLVLSFTDYDGLRQTSGVGWANYERLLSDPKVSRSLANTMIYAALTVPGTMIVSLGLATMLSKVGRRSAGIFRTLFYLPEVTPKVAVGVLFLLLFNVPRDLYEAAELDGVAAWQRFRHITLPMISGALFFTLIVQTIAALQTF